MPDVTDRQINSIKAEGKYRYIRFVKDTDRPAILQGAKDAQKGSWERIELTAGRSDVTLRMYLGQVIDLDSL